MSERIAKFLSGAGICSRREAERWILDGRICINGHTLTTPATLVTEADEVSVDGTLVSTGEPLKIWTFYKPAGLVTTHNDEKGRETVFDFIRKDPKMHSASKHIISVGRLDLNSEGLLILTNNGAFSRYAEHPSTGWKRTYRVRVFGDINEKELLDLKNGITIDGIHYKPADIRLPHQDKQPLKNPKAYAPLKNTWIEMTLIEGKNREIRRIMEHLGLQVNRLIRISYGPFHLDNLAVGDIKRTHLHDISQRPDIASFLKDNPQK